MKKIILICLLCSSCVIAETEDNKPKTDNQNISDNIRDVIMTGIIYGK